MTPSEYVAELFGFEGKIAVVIGGTGVLGGALCDGLAAAGAHVVVAGRSEERGLARVQAIIEAAGGIEAGGIEARQAASFKAVDVYSRDSLRSLCEQVYADHGRCDALVNCAGVNSAKPYAEISDDEWSRVIDGNLTATHLACQAFAPRMAEQAGGGSILNIGSVTSHLPLSRVFAYSASKAAVQNLTQNLGREFATRGVRVNVLCPGFFPAEQNRRILDKERIDNIMHGTPMNRFGEPDELIGAALLLLSQRAGSFITGASMYVDGGFTANRF